MTGSLLLLAFWTLLNAAWISSQSPEVTQLTYPVEHAECPVWDPRNNLLYYVNIHQGQVFRYDHIADHQMFITLEGEVAPALPSRRDPNLLIVGINRSVAAVDWNDQPHPTVRYLTNLAAEFPTSRVNEGKADSEGRLWIGTMGFEGPDGLTPDQGLLYLVTCDNIDNPTVQIAPVNISNGLAWNAANDRFFYIDTPSGQVASYAYDAATGAISDRSVVFDMRDHADQLAGGPDGMTIDRDDNLWVALYGGGAVIHIDSSNGELLQVVPIPARDVTSVVWGGENLDILFVTTSRISLTDEELEQYPAAGSVFSVVGLEARGVPLFEVDLLGSIDDQCGGAKKHG